MPYVTEKIMPLQPPMTKERELRLQFLRIMKFGAKAGLVIVFAGVLYLNLTVMAYNAQNYHHAGMP